MVSLVRALVVASSLLTAEAWSFGLPLHEGFHWAQTASHHVLPHVTQHTNPAVSLLHSYTQALAQHPLETKMATGATLAIAGDAIAQSQNEEEPYDKKRALSFGVFDTAYRAVQHNSFPFIVQHCQGQFLGPLLMSLPFLHIQQSYLAAMEQTLASQLGIVPFFYYPVFFSLTAAIQGLDAEAGIERAKENFLPLMKRNLLFWIPVQFVQFGFIPEDLQIPFLSACGLAWTFILSISAGSAKAYNKDEDLEERMEHGLSPEEAMYELNDAIAHHLLEEEEVPDKEGQLVGRALAETR